MPEVEVKLPLTKQEKKELRLLIYRRIAGTLTRENRERMVELEARPKS